MRSDFCLLGLATVHTIYSVVSFELIRKIGARSQRLPFQRSVGNLLDVSRGITMVGGFIFTAALSLSFRLKLVSTRRRSYASSHRRIPRHPRSLVFHVTFNSIALSSRAFSSSLLLSDETYDNARDIFSFDQL